MHPPGFEPRGPEFFPWSRLQSRRPQHAIHAGLGLGWGWLCGVLGVVLATALRNQRGRGRFMDRPSLHTGFIRRGMFGKTARVPRSHPGPASALTPRRRPGASAGNELLKDRGLGCPWHIPVHGCGPGPCWPRGHAGATLRGWPSCARSAPLSLPGASQSCTPHLGGPCPQPSWGVLISQVLWTGKWELAPT